MHSIIQKVQSIIQEVRSNSQEVRSIMQGVRSNIQEEHWEPSGPSYISQILIKGLSCLLTISNYLTNSYRNSPIYYWTE